MNKKNILILALALMMFAMAACSAPAEQPAPEESMPEETVAPVEETAETEETEKGFEVSVEGILDGNKLMRVLSQHDSLSYVERIYEGEELILESNGQFIFHEGRLWYDAEMVGVEEDRTLISGFINHDVPGTLSVVNMAGEETFKFLQVMPAAEYEGWLSGYWMMDYIMWDSMEITGTEEWDGGEIDGVEYYTDALLVTMLNSMEDGSLYSETEYLLDAETGHILYRSSADYMGGELASYTTVFVTYDEPTVSEAEAWGIVSGGEDTCELTVVFEPGTDAEEIQTFTVAKDVSVLPVSMIGYYELYSDAECTEAIESISIQEDSTVIYAVLKAME